MKYWKRIDEQGNITTVESYSHDLDVKGALEITQQEFDDYLASLLPPPPKAPPRDLAAEIDEIKLEIKALKEAR